MTAQTLQLEFISLLTTATKSRLLAWDAVSIDRLRSSVDGKQFEVQWTYWYDQAGITIDRQCIRIRSNRTAVNFCWGTRGMDYSLRLLGALAPEWDQHYKRICDALCSLNIAQAGGVRMSLQPSFEDQCNEALTNLLARTQENSLVWHAQENDVFVAYCGDHKYQIELLEPVNNEDAKLGRIIARVYLPRVILSFASGTPGMFLIDQILALSSPFWKQKVNDEIAALIEENMFLKSLIRSTS